jgi:hypothetical protein
MDNTINGNTWGRFTGNTICIKLDRFRLIKALSGKYRSQYSPNDALIERNLSIFILTVFSVKLNQVFPSNKLKISS